MSTPKVIKFKGATYRRVDALINVKEVEENTIVEDVKDAAAALYKQIQTVSNLLVREEQNMRGPEEAKKSELINSVKKLQASGRSAHIALEQAINKIVDFLVEKKRFIG